MTVVAPLEEETNVRVAARIRPLLTRERASNCCSCVAVEKSSRQVVVGTRRTFGFDIAFDVEATQIKVYDGCVASLLAGCLQGYNATVLAYGQTGSGKTHTMGTAQTNPTCPEDEGITPKVIRNSFAHIEQHRNDVEFKASCSFLEIYNEEIRDLLQPNAAKHLISVREHADGVIQVAGIHAEACATAEDMLRCLSDGSVQRTTGATLMNEHSSRSHSIFTLILEQRRGQGLCEEPEVAGAARIGDMAPRLSYRTAKFHLVDLAGSERAKRTGAVGSRFKESVAINAGLLALGKVISALGDPAKRGCHVPYRDSKLTRILQDSLGGNSRTWMVACVSCADGDFEETLNTLKYAHRARNIKNKPVVNHDPRVAQLAAMQDEIEALRSELQRVNDGGTNSAHISTPTNDAETREAVEKFEAAERRGSELADKLLGAEAEVQALRRSLACVHDAICSNLQTMCSAQGGAACRARQQACTAVNEALQAAKLVLGEAPGAIDGDTGLAGIHEFGINGRAFHDPFAAADASGLCAGADVPVDGDCSGILTDCGEMSRLSTLSEARKDSTPLIRKYLEEIRRLEDEVRRLNTELALHRRRAKQMQEELGEAREDLQKDEEIFEEKMLEMKALKERNEALEIELEEISEGGICLSAQGSGGRSIQAPLALDPTSTNGCLPSPQRLQAPFAARLEDTDEVRTDEPELERPRSARVDGPAGGKVVGGYNSLEVQAELEECNGIQQRLEHELQTMKQNVALKEGQIAELEKNEQEWGAVKVQFQRRMDQLQKELEAKQQELLAMQAQLEDSVHSKDRSRRMEEEKLQLERRIAEQMDIIRRKKQEFARVRELRIQDRKRSSDLEAEVMQSHCNQKEVEKRLHAELRRSARLEESKAVTTRAVETSRCEQQRQRPGAPPEGGRGAASRHAVVADMANNTPSEGCYGPPSASSSSTSRARLLEQQINEHIRRQEASQSLEDDRKKHENLLTKRAQYMSYRQKIVAKDAAEQHESRERLSQIEAKLAQLGQAVDSDHAIEPLDGISGAAGAEAKALASEHAELQRHVQEKRGESLQILHDIDERLEGLQDELDFREARIAKAQQFLRPEDAIAGALDAELAALPAEDAKELLSRYCEKVLRLRQREKQSWRRFASLEAQLEERGQQVSELQEVLRRQAANVGKSVAKVKQEYEGHVRELFRQLSVAKKAASREEGSRSRSLAEDEQQPPQHRPPSAQGTNLGSATAADGKAVAKEGSELSQLQSELSQLRHDNLYYKATNRELKRRLRTTLERGSGSGAVDQDSSGAVEDMAAQVERLEREKEALCEERGRVMSQMENLKQYASRFHNISSVASAGREERPPGVIEARCAAGASAPPR